MLPPGHLAAGYLTAKALLHFWHPALNQDQLNQMLWWGVFFGFAPDLDVFYLFFKSRAFKIDPRKGDHRLYCSHVPILWLAAGLLIFFVSFEPFWKIFGLMLWLCSWSHFVLDSIQYGIMWLWPLNNKVYGLFPVASEAKVEKNILEAIEHTFFSYWVVYLKEYGKGLKISLTCEVIVVLAALIYFFTK